MATLLQIPPINALIKNAKISKICEENKEKHHGFRQLVADFGSKFFSTSAILLRNRENLEKYVSLCKKLSGLSRNCSNNNNSYEIYHELWFDKNFFFFYVDVMKSRVTEKPEELFCTDLFYLHEKACQEICYPSELYELSLEFVKNLCNGDMLPIEKESDLEKYNETTFLVSKDVNSSQKVFLSDENFCNEECCRLFEAPGSPESVQKIFNFAVSFKIIGLKSKKLGSSAVRNVEIADFENSSIIDVKIMKYDNKQGVFFEKYIKGPISFTFIYRFLNLNYC